MFSPELKHSVQMAEDMEGYDKNRIKHRVARLKEV